MDKESSISSKEIKEESANKSMLFNTPASSSFQNQQQCINQLLQQYYRYLSLLKLTSNFCKNLQCYRNIKLSDYQGRIAIIGNCSKIDVPHDIQGQVHPIINTTILQSFMSKSSGQINHLSSPNRVQNQIKRKFLMNQKKYKQHLLAFNNIIKDGKHKKDQYYIFTNLKFFLSHDDKLFFVTTQKSMMIQLQKQFYLAKFKDMQNSFNCCFSEIDFEAKGRMGKDGTFLINDVRSWMQQAQQISIIGAIRKIYHDNIKEMNAKQKEIIVQLVQETWPYGYDKVGVCKVYIRFLSIDQDLILSFLKQGGVYMFLLNEVICSDNIQLVFRIQNYKKSITCIIPETQIPNLEDKYKNMNRSFLKRLSVPGIWRNFYKFKLVKEEVRFLNLRVQCQNQQCRATVVPVGSNVYKCRNQQCNGKGPVLKCWAIVICSDQTMEGELSLEDEQVIDFFGLERDERDILDAVAREQWNVQKKSLTLISKPSHGYSKDDDDFYDCKVYENNSALLLIANKCQLRVIEREIIATARVNQKDAYENECQSFRQDVQIGFTRSKEMLKSRPQFLNGQIVQDKYGWRLMPQLKVQKILPQNKK